MAILAAITDVSGNAAWGQVGVTAFLCLIGCSVIYLLQRRPAPAPGRLTAGTGRQHAVALFVRHSAALLFVGFSLLDWGLFSALRPLGVSFGSLGLALLGFGAVRLFLAASLVFSQRGAFTGRPSNPAPPFRRSGLFVLLALNLGLLALAVDGFYLEPQALGVTELSLPGPAWLPDRPLRIVHLTDLHVERLTHRERDLTARVAALQPDLIVLTGDYLNQEYVNDPAARQAAREVLSQLHAPGGVYAVGGSVDTPEIMAALFNGLNITVLADAMHQLPLAGGDLYLLGVTRSTDTLTTLMQGVPPGAYTLLLHHTPDLIESAAALGVNLYLAGHTHGGQIRLPFYGALVTFSTYGKRFEMGHYTVGPTTLYVSRGIGMEGLGLPRMRFLCPPEVEVFSLAAGR